MYGFQEFLEKMHSFRNGFHSFRNGFHGFRNGFHGFHVFHSDAALQGRKKKANDAYWRAPACLALHGPKRRACELAAMPYSIHADVLAVRLNGQLTRERHSRNSRFRNKNQKTASIQMDP